MRDTTLDTVRQHPTVARVRALVSSLDPELIDGVDEVDRTLIVSALARDPWDRVRQSHAQYHSLQEMARCLRSNPMR